MTDSKQNRKEVKLAGPATIAGTDYKAGDKVRVLPHDEQFLRKRDLIADGTRSAAKRPAPGDGADTPEIRPDAE